MSMMRQFPPTNWIWIPEGNKVEQTPGYVVLFRKKIVLEHKSSSIKIQISADSRYKLYVNGSMAEQGPCKGDQENWYVDTVELRDYLHLGENVIAIEVARFAQQRGAGPNSIVRTDTPCLYIKELVEEGQQEIGLSAKNGYRCYLAKGIQFRAANPGFDPLKIWETVIGDEKINGWMWSDFQDGDWQDAVAYNQLQVELSVSPFHLLQRPIPYMRRIPRKFMGVYDHCEGPVDVKDWEQLVQRGTGVTIMPHTTATVTFHAGEEMTGFLSLDMEGGKGSKVTMLTAESYGQDHPAIQQLPEPMRKYGKMLYLPIKGDRMDCENGRLQGEEDDYEVAGYGTESRPECYQPYWFRTFRFVQLTITTEDQPLVIHRFDYEETGYPLLVQSRVNTSDDSLKGIWDISLRSLRRCMHDTYMDCPFYEQLQYAMDSRSQILFTYSIAADDRLARQCMNDFRNSQRHDGMLLACYPSDSPNVIPGFAIYYLLMLHDHMMYFGDKAFLREHLACADRVLEYFHRNLDERGLVGKIGGVSQDPNEKYWSFIDWSTAWTETRGVPLAASQGPITMESLLYILGLQKMAEVVDYCGRSGIAQEYRQRAVGVQQAVKQHCLDDQGVYMDGPQVAQYSVHSQIFALLTDTVDIETGKRNLLEALDNPDKYAQVSVAMMYYLYRGLEKADAYEKTDACWNLWRQMLKDNLTTCVEDDTKSRSDCHAWGSLALYELPATCLGVRPAAPGYSKMQIHPVCGALEWADGDVITPVGMVHVSWKKTAQGLKLDYEAPEDVEVIL